jgi:superfamily II DNA or RNA helicase
VLAHVRHRVLPGTDVELSQEELRYLQHRHRLPAHVEERIGLDIARNRLLVSEIAKLPRGSTALLFATSVEHAQTMAALLSLEGIPAKAILGNTPPGARRRYIEAFRTKELRVLTNFSVLTQGFDAPAVEAIFVARPTYSPNLYQQMIGRGLRGPVNGGTEECLIVNVEDNVAQYGEQLAFREFEHLWRPA